MFRFRLQRLLDLRQAHENAKAVEMVRAEAACDAARAVLADLQAARQESRARLNGATGADATVGEFQNIAFVLEQIDRQVTTASDTMAQAENAAARIRQDLNEAHVERRVLDLLRERHEADWRDAEVSVERQTMDAIALTRYTQRGSTSE